MGFRYLIRRPARLAMVAALALGCAVAAHTTPLPETSALAAWWQPPTDLPTRDLFWGPWGREHAPDPNAEYTFLRPKVGGFNPGVVVRDPRGREWHVKQASEHHGAEGPSEVVLSRVLSAIGYHQPPVYYLPSFHMLDAKGRMRVEPGGRFRVHDASLTDRGEWTWQKSPFIDHPSFNGLLAILMLFNQSELKNSNNTLYSVKGDPSASEWYVVRDLGNALGRTGKIAPQRNNLELFAESNFIAGVHHGFVDFDYHGRYGEMVRDRITPADVAWGCNLLARLTDRQWNDAFRAGGYPPDEAARFIAILRSRIAEGQRIGAAGATTR
jgi:hypothetical protein